MITPAKWQAKGGKKNEDFRKDIVPHMSKIVYYHNSKDIFEIAEQGGICYFVIDSYLHSRVKIKNRDLNRCHPGFNTEFEDIDIRLNWSLYNNQVQSIIIKTKRKQFIFSDNIKKYNLIATGAISGGNSGKEHRYFDFDNKISVVSNFKLMTNNESLSNYGSTIKVYYQSDNLFECKSFESYVGTRLVRFLIFVGLCKLSVRDNLTWRFVPDPGPFDHIFTDAELYKKYNLTEEEINIIESVIKERKND